MSKKSTKPIPTPPNHRKEWKPQDDARLRRDARAGMDTDDIAKDLGRTVNAIYSHASEINVSLDPPDKK